MISSMLDAFLWDDFSLDLVLETSYNCDHIEVHTKADVGLLGDERIPLRGYASFYRNEQEKSCEISLILYYLSIFLPHWLSVNEHSNALAIFVAYWPMFHLAFVRATMNVFKFRTFLHCNCMAFVTRLPLLLPSKLNMVVKQKTVHAAESFRLRAYFGHLFQTCKHAHDNSRCRKLLIHMFICIISFPPTGCPFIIRCTQQTRYITPDHIPLSAKRLQIVHQRFPIARVWRSKSASAPMPFWGALHQHHDNYSSAQAEQ